MTLFRIEIAAFLPNYGWVRLIYVMEFHTHRHMPPAKAGCMLAPMYHTPTTHICAEAQSHHSLFVRLLCWYQITYHLPLHMPQEQRLPAPVYYATHWWSTPFINLSHGSMSTPSISWRSIIQITNLHIFKNKDLITIFMFAVHRPTQRAGRMLSSPLFQFIFSAGNQLEKDASMSVKTNKYLPDPQFTFHDTLGGWSYTGLSTCVWAVIPGRHPPRRLPHVITGLWWGWRTKEPLATWVECSSVEIAFLLISSAHIKEGWYRECADRRGTVAAKNTTELVAVLTR